MRMLILINYLGIYKGEILIFPQEREKKPQSGHVWIWDGVQVNANSEVTLVHCNWGHGFTSGISDSDGWYTISRMEQPDPDMQPYFDDNVQIYITNY